MNVHLGEEPVFIGSEVALHTEHDSVNVDQGRVHIDAHDDEHVIRVKHTKDDGIDIFHAVDRETDAVTMRIESSGVLTVPDIKYIDQNGVQETLLGMDEAVDLNLNVLAERSAFDDGTKNNIVTRSITSGTEINNLHVVADSSNYTASFPPAGLYFTEATGRGELNMVEDGRIRFQPYDVDGTALMDRTFAFGRAVPEAGETDITADARRDGLLLEDATLDQSAEIMVSNTLPTLRLIGTKATATSGGHTEPVCPVIDVQDGTEISRFAVYDDGFVVQRGHQDVSPDALNAGHFSSVLAGDDSVYVGSCKISYDRAAKALRFRTLKEAVPVYLAGKGVTGAPAGHTLASMTVHGWVAYARQHQSNERLTVHDVFPPDAADWDDAAIRSRTVRTKRIREEDDSKLKLLRVDQMLASDSSVWLGDNLHVSGRDGRAQLQVRLPTIPVYLQGLGVQTSDLTAIGKTAATATLDDWITLSAHAQGSDDLSVIFPVQNQASDFELRTIVNELLVKPQTNNAPAGVTIDQAAGGHPVLHFKGNAAGNGLIMFGDQSASKSEIFRSATTNNLELHNSYGKVRVEATALDLSANTLLTREGVSIEGGGGSAEVTESIYVDSSYGGATSDGSVLKPYSSLSTALAAHLTEGATVAYCFRLAPGTYTGAISLDFSQTQSFAIKGSGADCTFVQAGATFAAGSGQTALYFRDFVNVEISDITVQNCLYGIYPRACSRVVVRNCVMQYCGSDGTVNRHNQTGTQAEQATFWGSASTSSGGAARFRNCGSVQIQDNTVRYCLRGLRVQDCGTDATASIISNNCIYRTLESGIYLAAGTYTGASGCRSVQVVGNQVQEAFNNGILVIGGQHNIVQGNCISRSANAGVMCWHVLDTRVCNNSLFDCNRRTYNGIGNLGDAFGNIVFEGSTAIGTGDYIGSCSNNSILKAGQGRAAAVYAITLGGPGGTITNPGYPTASNKVHIDSNYSDAAINIQNEHSVSVSTFAPLVGNLAATTSLESTAAAQFELKSTNPLISGVEQVKYSMVLDRGATANDFEYKTWNHYGHLLHSRIRDGVDLGLYGFDQDTGCLTISGGRYNDVACNSTLLRQWVGVPTDLSAQFLGRASFRHGLRLPVSFTPASATAAGTEGDVHQDGDYVWVRGASEWKKAPLQDFGASASSGPQVYYHDHTTGNTGAQSTTSNWFQLPNNTDIEIHVGGTGGNTELNRYLYRLPLNGGVHGQKIKVYNASQGCAFSNINNSVSWIYVKDDSGTAPHQLNGGNGGVAGNMCMYLQGHSAEIICRHRSYINQWTMHSSGASVVLRTTI